MKNLIQVSMLLLAFVASSVHADTNDGSERQEMQISTRSWANNEKYAGAGGDGRIGASVRTGSSKNERHGDGGRANAAADRKIGELERQIKENNLNRKERNEIRQRIKNIRETAQRKEKGETHGIRGK